MRRKLEALKQSIEAANSQPVFAMGAKIKHAERAVVQTYALLEDIIIEIERLNREQN